jgi:hypothetical protein
MFGSSLSKVIIRCVLTVGILATGVYFCLSSSALDVSPKTGVIMDLPQTLGGLTGEIQEVSAAELAVLPADTEFAKMAYGSDDSLRLHAQIVLAGAEKRSIHRPEVCLPGQGWTIKSSQTMPITLADGKTMGVTLLNISIPIRVGNQTRELTQLFSYWFVGYDTTTPSHLVRIAKTNMDVLLHNTNHRWAYIIVSAPVLEGFAPGGRDLPETKEFLLEAIRELAPQIMKSAAEPEIARAVSGT